MYLDNETAACLADDVTANGVTISQALRWWGYPVTRANIIAVRAHLPR